MDFTVYLKLAVFDSTDSVTETRGTTISLLFVNMSSRFYALVIFFFYLVILLHILLTLLLFLVKNTYIKVLEPVDLVFN